MKHKLVTLVLAVAVIVSLVIAGCAKPAPAPPPTPPPAPAPAEPIKLRLAHPNPPATVFNWGMLEPWAKMIEERTAAIGKPVEITIFAGGSLAKRKYQYKSVVSGISDIASMIVNQDVVSGGGLATVMELPLLFPNATVGAQVAQELFETWPEFRDEYAEVKVLWFQPPPPGHVQGRTRPIKTLEDFRGLTAFAGSGLGNDIVKEIGAVPVSMFIPEVYIALQSGVLDLVVKEWVPSVGFKWYEVTKYRTALPRGMWLGLLATVMNWDTWNSLPPDVQDIFEELGGMYMSKFSGEAFDKENERCLEFLKEYDKKVGNPEIYNLPEDEFQRWVDAVSPVYDDWVARIEAKGLPGGAILDDVLRLRDKYEE